MKKTLMTAMTIMISMMSVALLSSCSDEDDYDVVKREQTVDLKCQKPDYLKPGDKVALISPSYFTPMENVEKTAEVLRKWGLEPVIGPNVGKVVDGRYAVFAGHSTIRASRRLSVTAAAMAPSSSSTS